MTQAKVGLIEGAGICISGDACHGVRRNTGDKGEQKLIGTGGTMVSHAYKRNSGR